MTAVPGAYAVPTRIRVASSPRAAAPGSVSVSSVVSPRRAAAAAAAAVKAQFDAVEPEPLLPLPLLVPVPVLAAADADADAVPVSVAGAASDADALHADAKRSEPAPAPALAHAWPLQLSLDAGLALDLGLDLALDGGRPVLVTGAAGFIGSAVCARLAAMGYAVAGCDNFNDYYDPTHKRARVQALLKPVGVACEHVELSDGVAVAALFERVRPRLVVHLAAQAGVRYSLQNPAVYLQSNVIAFGHILELCRKHGVAHLVYASSSSVYGANAKTPFSEADRTDEPVSLYAATKKSNELMAYTYSHLYGIPITGLRFFTVYGPWGRPDMAYYSFARKILGGEKIPVFAGGKLHRDFTYIDDIVEGVARVLFKPSTAANVSAARAAAADDAKGKAQTKGAAVAAAGAAASAGAGAGAGASVHAPAHVPHAIFNIGNSQPVEVLDFIRLLEQAIGVTAELDFQPMQPGDVPATHADATRLQRWVGFRPTTTLRDGLRRFAQWYKHYQHHQHQYQRQAQPQLPQLPQEPSAPVRAVTNAPAAVAVHAAPGSALVGSATAAPAHASTAVAAAANAGAAAAAPIVPR